MAYTAPTITASSGTFAQLQTGGLTNQLELLIAANSGLSQAQINLVRAFAKPDMVKNYQRIAVHIDDFLHGDPVVYATFAASLLDYATAFTVLKTALDEIGTLAEANQGTLTTTSTPIGLPRPVRTFP